MWVIKILRKTHPHLGRVSHQRQESFLGYAAMFSQDMFSQDMFSQEKVFSVEGTKSGGTKSGGTKLESGDLSQDFLRSDEWRKIVAQVESALCREDRSRQALDQLQQLASEQGASTQFLLKSVIRETIRLTLECYTEASDLLKYNTIQRSVGVITAPTPVLTLEQPEPSENPQQSEPKEAQEDDAIFNAITHVLTPAPEKSWMERLRPTRKPKLTTVAIDQPAIESREEALNKACSVFRQHRMHLDLTLAELHASTFIPLRHLQSLEEGTIDRLPEDVYLRGFLHRLEKALSLTDGQLTQALPATVQIHHPIMSSASTTRSSYRPALAFSPNYAYLTYTALMAGGICLIAQQGSPKSNLPPLKIDIPAPVSGPQNSSQKTSSQKTSSQKVQQTRAQIHQVVASPEVFA
jgi:cytoskeleton protein RodZ